MSNNQTIELTESRRSENEISLVDLWLLIVKQKTIILTVLIACMILGVLFALMMPKIYLVSSTIEIGTKITEEKTSPIEQASNVQVKINNAYIPFVLNKFYSDRPDSENDTYEIKASNPTNSEMIILNAEATTESIEKYKQLINSVVKLLVDDHARVSNIIRKGYEVDVAAAENLLASFKDEQKLLVLEGERIKSKKTLLEKQLEEKKKQLTMAIESRDKLLRYGTDKAMTVLLIDNEIQQYQGKIDYLEERLFIKLIKQEDERQRKLSDNERDQVDQKNKADQIKLQLDNVIDTRAIVPVMQSDEPVNTRGSIIAIGATMFGLFLGLIVAFILEFLNYVKQKKALNKL